MLRQERIERGGVVACPELGHGAGIAHPPRDARQRLEMIGAGAFRGEQHEDEIDRLVTDDGISEDWKNRFEDLGIEVQIAA